MDKIVQIDAHFLGRLLRASDREYGFRFEVSETEGNWIVITIPVELKNSIRYEDTLNPEIKPLSVEGNLGSPDKGNVKVYENLVRLSNTSKGIQEDSLVSIRVPEKAKFFRVVTRCPRCEMIYPSENYPDRYTENGEFIVANGEIK